MSNKDGKRDEPHQIPENANLKGDTVFTHRFTWQSFFFYMEKSGEVIH